jgi:hypothetical protein
MTGHGRGCVKTQNEILRFRFWRFLMNRFAQNRTTIDFIATFRSIAVVATSFYTTSAGTRRMPVPLPDAQHKNPRAIREGS